MTVRLPGVFFCRVWQSRHVSSWVESASLSSIAARLVRIPGNPIHGIRYWSFCQRNLCDLYEEAY